MRDAHLDNAKLAAIVLVVGRARLGAADARTARRSRRSTCSSSTFHMPAFIFIAGVLHALRGTGSRGA